MLMRERGSSSTVFKKGKALIGGAPLAARDGNGTASVKSDLRGDAEGDERVDIRGAALPLQNGMFPDLCPIVP